MKDAGWRPVSPTEWRRPVGAELETWQFPDIDVARVSGDFDISELVLEFASDLKAFLWMQASQHDHGEDLATGGDVTVLRSELQRFLRKDEFDLAGQMVTVAIGVTTLLRCNI